MNELKKTNSLILDFMANLSNKVDKIAEANDADVNRVLFRIVGNYIEVYEIDLSEESVKSFLGSFETNDLIIKICN
jgi:thymidine phosphorylase